MKYYVPLHIVHVILLLLHVRMGMHKSGKNCMMSHHVENVTDLCVYSIVTRPIYTLYIHVAYIATIFLICYSYAACEI